MAKIVITGTEVNSRVGPGLDYDIHKKVYLNESFPHLRTESDGAYNWYAHKSGWTRSDLSKLVEDVVGGAGVIVIGENNVPQFLDYWHLDFAVKGDFEGGWGAYGGTHKGWDISNNVGTPVYPVPGGVLREVNVCQKCTPLEPSSYGRIPTQQVYVDPGWGYGWGTYTVYEYPSHLLPPHTQQMFPGQSAYVLYGHLSQTPTKDSIGRTHIEGTAMKMGNTGNSSGPHLHIEVRFSVGTGQAWRRIGPSVDPGVLFTR